MTKQTMTNRLMINLELERDVDQDGDTELVIVKGSIVLDRTFHVGQGAQGTKTDTNWYSLTELDGGSYTIVQNDNSILHAETYEDAVNILLTRFESMLRVTMMKTLRVIDDD